jgi:RNA polymerase sigma-70 factor (ECF subfamily)
MTDQLARIGEIQLLQQVLAGKTEAYGQIFRLHRNRAYGLALQYTRNKEDALDVVQDAFVRAYLNLSRFDLGKDFGPWLLTIVRNLSIDLLRKRRRTAGEELPEVIPDRPGTAGAEDKLLQEEVWSKLSKLAPDHREIVFLKDYQGHSYAEIAEILSIPIGTVMSRLHHARKNLASAVSEKAHEMR